MTKIRFSVTLGLVVATMLMEAKPVRADDAPDGRITVGRSNRLFIDDGEIVAAESATLTGPDGRPLDLTDFYRDVGRPDLAEEVSTRRLERGLLIGGGIAVGVAGTLWSTISFASCVGEDVRPGQAERNCALQMIPLIVGETLSFVGVFGGLAIDPNPLTTDGMAALADRYNAALPRATTQIMPYGSTDGGGLLVSGSF